MLLDEPSLGLAPVVVDTLFDALIEIHASGVSILLVEQNVTRALAISERMHSDASERAPILNALGYLEKKRDPAAALTYLLVCMDDSLQLGVWVQFVATCGVLHAGKNRAGRLIRAYGS